MGRFGRKVQAVVLLALVAEAILDLWGRTLMVRDESSSNEATQQDDLSPLFIPTSELNRMRNDPYGASWWMSKDRFLGAQLDLTNHFGLEGASFVPLYHVGRGDGFNDVRMTTDYLDFSVEHMSKFWKFGKVESMTALRMREYASAHLHSELLDDAMKTTIAVMPFAVNDDEDQNTQDVWRAALMATIVSLLQHGISRVVVFGYYEMDAVLTSQVFSFLTDKDVDPSDLIETALGSTELAFVRLTEAKRARGGLQLPQAVLIATQNAFKGNATYSCLGPDPSRFQYVFFTESDQILQARMSARFFEEMDHGGALVPHRLQPVPHHADKLQGFNFQTKSLPSSQQAYWLDPEKDSCCDTGNYHTGHERRTCPYFWWFCGYLETNGDFAHQERYDFIRLSSGTGIVSVAGTEHSRRCEPRIGHRGCPIVATVRGEQQEE